MNTVTKQSPRTPMQWVNECSKGQRPASADYVCGGCEYVEGMGADDARTHLSGFSVAFFSDGDEPELECLECGSKTVTGHLSAEGSC